MDKSWINSSSVGKTGEDIACSFLIGRKHIILDRNFRKPYGEIDIISKIGDILHFIEVKSVKVGNGEDYMPEQNVHYKKRLRLAKTIKSYLAEKKFPLDTEYVIDVIAIFLDFDTRKARIRVTENVILLE